MVRILIRRGSVNFRAVIDSKPDCIKEVHFLKINLRRKI